MVKSNIAKCNKNSKQFEVLINEVTNPYDFGFSDFVVAAKPDVVDK